ncbi:MAG: GatB/YqeY domain-containing protein [Alphaproteobacteria bacterium]|nr:GatB/YqeY domain-containing protein [Alphaproteobacteria bacterium]
MRDAINAALKDAIKTRDSRRTTTLRLINAAIKDRDIAARSEGRDAIDDAEVMALLHKMVKQREESVAIYDRAGRTDLAEQERGEIEVIRDFLPRPLSDEDIANAVSDAIAKTGAAGLRDMGKVIDALKARYPGRIDFSKASRIVKQKLGA